MGDIKFVRPINLGLKALFTAAALLCMSLTSTAAAQNSLQETARTVTVSEQDIYQNPDDNELNLQYAKEQIRLGEMLNAGAALERMLYSNPNWHSARLLYAAVLYRLDDQKAALRELSLLEKKELNAQQLETLTRYKEDFQLTRIDSVLPVSGANPSYTGPRAFRPVKPVSGKLIIGAAADSNAGNAFSDEAFGFSDQGDISAFIGGKVELFVPISNSKTTLFTAGANVLTRRHETFSRADYGVYDVHAGVRIRAGKARASLDVVGRQLNISGEKYLTQIGPRVSYSQPVSSNTHVNVSLGAYNQDYDNLDFAPLEDERDGVKTVLQLGVATKLKPTQTILTAIGYETKSADLSAFAYTGPVAAIEFKQGLENGKYFNAQIRARQLNFEGSLQAGNSDRKDSRLTARAAIGIPLGEITPKKIMDAAILEIGANYNRRNSNIETNDYKNIGADLRLIIGF